MAETPFFFTNGNYRLFGILYEPREPSKKEGFVFCDPFAEEKLWAQRVMVNFARDLAYAGYPVLRFDYMGTGDSEGEFEECSIETKLSDIHCAINTLQERVHGVDSLGLVGLRLGATLASLAADNGDNLKKIILWDPILNGSSYMTEMLRINLATQSAVFKEIRHNTEALIQLLKDGKTVNVDGYEMSWPLYAQSVGIDLLNRKISFAGVSLLVQISRKAGNITQPYNLLQSRLGNCEAVLAVEEPFWKEIKPIYAHAETLFRLTKEWLER